MASSYTTSLLVEKIADNEQENTWGTTMRANWDLEDKAIAQIGTLTAAGGTTTVSDANFAYNKLELTGTLTAAQVYLMPARAKTWWVRNQHTHGTFGVTGEAWRPAGVRRGPCAAARSGCRAGRGT